MKTKTKQNLFLSVFIAIIVLIFPIGPILLMLFSSPEEEKLSASQSLDKLESYFYNFPQTEVIKGIWKRYPIMGNELIVYFRLPDVQGPREWLELMSEKISDQKGINLKFVSKYRLEQSMHYTDVYYIEYDPSEKAYKAHFLWD